MEHWQIELIERLARVEENQKNMLSNIHKLPQSPQCGDEIKALKIDISELKTFKDAVQRKIAYVGGVIVTIGLVVPYIFNWVATHLHWRTP